MSKKTDLQKEIDRLGNLKNLKDKSKEYIEKQAKLNIKIREFKSYPLFENDKLQKLAEERFKAYLEAHEIESFSDLDTLRSLVYNEIFEAKIQKQLNETKIPSDKLTKQLIEVQNQKSSLKVKLGIDKSEEEDDDLTALQKLKKRMHTYIQFNKNEFTTVSPCCGKMLLFRRRVKDFNSLIHPMFSGRWYYNARAIALVKEGKMTKEQYAWIFHTSPDYVDWCIENEAEIIELSDIDPKELKKFIKEKWYLKDGFQKCQIYKKDKK